ncbi:MAG: prohibitin family protein [Bacteroidales bacterium]|nr:prohibitin family protein [Bacteroidales bacterium]
MSEYQEINWRKLKPYLIGGAIIIVLIILAKSTFVILKPTERGVVFRKYSSGLDVDKIHTEGLNIIAPWNEMIKFDIAEKQIEETMDVLSENGLYITIDVTLRYRPIPEKIGYLYQQFRMDYAQNLIRPEVRSVVRQVIGQYKPEELYSTKRGEIELQISENTRQILLENHVELKALLLRSIKLPATIQKSIEDKLTAEQEALKYQYLLQQEQQEAERRRIDAEGKAAANRLLNASLTDNILREKGIIATQELAASPNAKIIIIGSGEDGLPVILGGN